MGNGRRLHRRQQVQSSSALDQYASALTATGMDEREVARAVIYAETYGMDALSGPRCVTFSEPSCNNWNCLRPDHQRLEK